MTGIFIFFAIIAVLYIINKLQSNPPATYVETKLPKVNLQEIQQQSTVQKVALETATEIPSNFDFNDELQIC
jgi:hypothetical protein